MILLLTPHRLMTDLIILETFHLNKEGKIGEYKTTPLDSAELRKFYSGASKEAREVLIGFGPHNIQVAREELRKSMGNESSEKAITEFSRKAMLRIMYDRMARLKSFSSLFKWRHKIETREGKFLISPCTFNLFRPELNFEVVSKADKISVRSTINLNRDASLDTLIRRFHFLLEVGNEYFLLSYKDYHTLEWLEKESMLYENDIEGFSRNILSRLETDYPVNRNNLFNAGEIRVRPSRRIMLSEISHSFLMLRPQWLYDGFVQEYPWKQHAEVRKDGQVFSVVRNKEEEDEFVTLLQHLHPNFQRQLNGYFFLPFADAQKSQWFLKVYRQLLESDIEVAGMDMLQHFRYSKHAVSTVVKIIEESANLILIDLKITFGTEEAPLAELQKMLLAGQRAILLKDGSLGILTDEWFQSYGAMIRHGKIQQKWIQVSRWVALSEQQEGQPSSLPGVIKKEWWKKWNHWKDSADALYALPAELNIQALRPYQHKGYEWLRLLAEAGASACLADDMGLGKTIQAICFLAHRLQENPDRKHLVICPTSLIYNWQEELQKFAPNISTAIYHGAGRQEKILTSAAARLILTSYGTVRSDVEMMSRIHFDTVVVDESHNIKNPTALITQAMSQLTSTIRIALSGTPVMNNTFDLYAQLSFLFPGMFGGREFFKKQYADPIDRYRDEEKIKALQKLTSPFILRRTKEQVAPDLPEKTETILWCSMKSDQRLAYENIRDSIRSSLFLEIKEKGLAAGKLSILHGLMKLRQVCNSGELVKGEDQFTTESIKTRMLIEELANITLKHKALVFSQFTGMLDLLENDLTKEGLSYLRLDGSTEPARRQQLVNQFNNENGKERVFLISLKAGNAGLNLTAADYVFLFDPWWNTAVEQQAIDRTHRIGQTKNVFAYKLICKDTIEERIIHLQNRKISLTRELIGGEEGLLAQLTQEDLQYLFS